MSKIVFKIKLKGKVLVCKKPDSFIFYDFCYKRSGQKAQNKNIDTQASSLKRTGITSKINFLP